MHERPILLGEALRLFFDDLLLEGRSRATVKTYASQLRAFQDDPRPLSALTPALCRSMTAERMKLARATARTFSGALRSFCSFLASTYGVPNPCADVPVPRNIPPPHRYLKPVQIQKLWAACPDDAYRLLVLLLLEGVRASEAAGLRWRDVSGDTALIRGKGAKYRRIALSAPLVAALELAPKSGERVLGYGYNALQWRIARLGRLAGVPVHAHLFRHSWASNGLMLGMDTSTLQTLGGWSPASAMLQRYIASAREEAALDRSREFGLTSRLLGEHERRGP